MNQYEGIGGSYLQDQNGDVVQIEKPTIDHPDGNCAREVEQTPLVQRSKPSITFKDSASEHE